MSVGPSHNYYYLGRAESDITEFISFFCLSMADALGTVSARAAEAAGGSNATDDSAVLRRLDPRRRRLLELFHVTATATTAQMAAQLGLSARTVSSLVPRWVEDGFFEGADASRRSRAYRLTPPYERLPSRPLRFPAGCLLVVLCFQVCDFLPGSGVRLGSGARR